MKIKIKSVVTYNLVMTEVEYEPGSSTAELFGVKEPLSQRWFRSSFAGDYDLYIMFAGQGWLLLLDMSGLFPPRHYVALMTILAMLVCMYHMRKTTSRTCIVSVPFRPGAYMALCANV